MSAETQEGQKTVVSFIVGLLIGGLLVWSFSGPSAEAPKDKDKKDDAKEEVSKDKKEEETKSVSVTETKEEVVKKDVPAPALTVGDGKVTVKEQTAGTFVTLDSATYPVAEGWIGVREYTDGKLGNILGVSRFSQVEGLVPTGITLQRPTTTGKDYAVLVFTENGDKLFNSANDKQLDSVFATFTAK